MLIKTQLVQMIRVVLERSVKQDKYKLILHDFRCNTGIITLYVAYGGRRYKNRSYI